MPHNRGGRDYWLLTSDCASQIRSNGDFRAVILPNFLIIGAPRCSTTSMHEWLGQHPDFFMSALKEPSYYAFEEGSPQNQIPRPDQFIHRLIDYAPLFEHAGGRKIVGESSTLYLQIPEAPDRLAAALPEVKMVAILRDPADRCFSHYLQHRNVGAEDVSVFREALDDLPRRRAAGWTVNYDYIEPGYYAKHLANFYRVFGKERIKIIQFEEVRKDPTAVLGSICRFVGVSEDFAFDTAAIRNESGVPRSGGWNGAVHSAMRKLSGVAQILPSSLRSPIANRMRKAILEKPVLSQEDRAHLVEIYHDDVVRLEAMLGVDLSAWREVRRTSRSAGPPAMVPRSEDAVPTT